jgi:hypothetical protein
MRAEVGVMGQNLVDKIIKMLNIKKNSGCLFEPEELTV